MGQTGMVSRYLKDHSLIRTAILALLWIAAVAPHVNAQAAPGASTAAPPVPLIAPQQSQVAPDVNVHSTDANSFEYGESVKDLPQRVYRSLLPAPETPEEDNIAALHARSIDDTTQALTLKQAIYIAVRNNPIVAQARLDPLSATEGVRMAYGVFDPDLIATIDTNKTVLPATTALEVKGTALVIKNYDWNFTVNKVLRATNGTLTLFFNNNRALTNNLFDDVTPGYTPTLGLGLIQPLLRNLGWEFSTLSVRFAKSAQRQSQLRYAGTLNDFVQAVGDDYWTLVLAQENVAVANSALQFNQDLVRQNAIAVKVGTLAPIDLQEAESAAATSQANVYSADAALEIARAQLRQDVMLNPRGSFVPEKIDPAEHPAPNDPVDINEEQSIETAISTNPPLAALREQLRSQDQQVKYQQNELLPSLNLVSAYSLTSLGGTNVCSPSFGGPSNCAFSTAPAIPGFQPNYPRSYGGTLNQLFGFHYYTYSFLMTFELPMDNAPIEAQLAQARLISRQLREQYQAAISQLVVEVESALANVTADVKRVKAAKAATDYARQALHDEEVRFRVGIATTHDLLQFQNSEVSAEGSQVQAETDLEKAKIALRHAENTLLRSFQIDFAVQPEEPAPWYAKF